MKLLDLFPKVSPLNEMDFYDKSPITKVLQRNRGRFIHFTKGVPSRKPSPEHMVPVPDKADYDTGGYNWSKRMKQYNKALTRANKMNDTNPVPKLGINPNAFWRDPKGLYFFLVDALLRGDDRTRSGQMFATDYPYYYICDINLNDPNGVILQTITWDQVSKIAERNGWKKEMDEFRSLPLDTQKAQLFNYAKPKLPGGFLWHFIDRRVQDGKTTWGKSFRGISFIRDENGSIIHSNEPDQIVVFDPKVIKIVEQGETKPVDQAKRFEQDGWLYALVNVFKAVRGEVGGDLLWKNKKPSLTFKLGWATYSLALPEKDYDVGIRVNYSYGRAVGDYYIKLKTLEDQTQDQIVASIVKQAKHIAGLKTDINFKPCIPIEQTKVFLSKFVVDEDLNFNEERVNNDSTRDYCAVYLKGSTESQPTQSVSMKVDVHCKLSPDDFDLGVYLFMNGCNEAYAQVNDFTPDQKEEALDALAAQFIKSLESHFHAHSPAASYQKIWKIWREPSELEAYKGWLALNCPSIGGRIHEHYRPQIEAYNDLPERDRNNLKADISYKIRRD